MSTLSAARGLFKFHEQGSERVPILKDVELEIAIGEFVCVMGPSGSGKSTLLHILSGLDRASAGSVQLAGRELEGLGERQRTLLRREQIGYVFQFFNLLPNLTVEENIGLPLSIGGCTAREVRSKIEELAQRLGIAERLKAFPHELSGGEMQRTSIARALIGEQPLLLCDEPTGNLSQKAGAEVMELLRACVDEEGRSVLLVTHNPRDAALADRVHFLVDGELVSEPVLRGPGLTTDLVHQALGELHI